MFQLRKLVYSRNFVFHKGRPVIIVGIVKCTSPCAGQALYVHIIKI
jgi:hypothetical protein